MPRQIPRQGPQQAGRCGILKSLICCGLLCMLWNASYWGWMTWYLPSWFPRRSAHLGFHEMPATYWDPQYTQYGKLSPGQQRPRQNAQSHIETKHIHDSLPYKHRKRSAAKCGMDLQHATSLVAIRLDGRASPDVGRGSALSLGFVTGTFCSVARRASNVLLWERHRIEQAHTVTFLLSSGFSACSSTC